MTNTIVNPVTFADTFAPAGTSMPEYILQMLLVAMETITDDKGEAICLPWASERLVLFFESCSDVDKILLLKALRFLMAPSSPRSVSCVPFFARATFNSRKLHDNVLKGMYDTPEQLLVRVDVYATST
jgi:hypothetical protein